MLRHYLYLDIFNVKIHNVKVDYESKVFFGVADFNNVVNNNNRKNLRKVSILVYGNDRNDIYLII